MEQYYLRFNKYAPRKTELQLIEYSNGLTKIILSKNISLQDDISTLIGEVIEISKDKAKGLIKKYKK